jgi:hypothetical protein
MHFSMFFFATAALMCAADVRELAFLAGCWEMRGAQQVIEEQWMKPAGDTMLGSSRTIRGEKTVFYEQVLLHKKEGEVFYTVRLAGRPDTTSFRLVKSTGSEAVFENPDHDFPRRIIYRKEADGLFARIEGVQKGKEHAEDIPMKRAACQ